MPLHLDYRPKDFSEFIGNKQTVNSIRAILKEENKPHSYLLYGPSGCGKTTLARIIASELGCDPSEFYEMNTANTRGIDTIRDIILKSQFYPLYGKIKVYLFDEAHQITGQAAEALLKLLEDTPSHIYIILATTVPEKLLKTVRNRCTTFEVHSLNDFELGKIIDWVLRCEEKTMDESVVKKIIDSSNGSPRTSLVLLGQVINLPEKERLEAVDRADYEEKSILELCRMLIESRIQRDVRWARIRSILKDVDQEPETIRRTVLGYLSSCLIKGHPETERIAKMMDYFFPNLYDTGRSGLILQFYYASKA